MTSYDKAINYVDLVTKEEHLAQEQRAESLSVVWTLGIG